MSSSKSAGGVVAHNAQVGAPPGTRGAAGRERWWFKHAATGPHRRGPGVVRIIRAGVSGLPDSVGEGEEIVRAGHGRLVRAGQVNDFPSQGGCQSGRMFGAQIVAMRLCKGRKGPQNSCRIGIDVRQSCHGRFTAGGSGALTKGSHGSQDYPPRGDISPLGPRRLE